MIELKKLEKDIKEIKTKQEKILSIIEDALCPTASNDFERNQLIAQHGGDVLAALREHNKRQKAKPRTHPRKAK